MNGLLGVRDQNINFIESVFGGVKISARGNEITLDGKSSDEVASIIEELITLLESGQELDEVNLSRVVNFYRDKRDSEGNHENGSLETNYTTKKNGVSNFSSSRAIRTPILETPRGVQIKPETIGQQRYVDAINRNIITFGLGPAGTGKSWLAVAMAVKALKEKQVERIIMTRPAVEAGERLGFLPGDLMAKIDPYLRPLYDAVSEFQTPEVMSRLLEQSVIEVAPLAFMRGRTLNNSFVILDEAQNTTPAQMKMFLTRIGFGTKAVVTGDTTQIDVAGNNSSLPDLELILGGVEGLEFIHLSSKDVVRHPIVTQIVNAYDSSR